MLFIPNYFSSNTDFHLDQQLKLLCSFNEQVPCNTQGEYAENSFKTLLQSLKTTKISDSLRASFNDGDLNKWKEYAKREFDEMGRINRLRLQNMVELADKEMLQAIFEILLMFDINPLNSGPLKVQEKSGKFDKEGRPVMGTLTFDVFQKGAIHGIDGLERFLPSPSIKGEAGMDAYLENEFSGTDLISHFKQSAKHPIKAIISSGSFGGIGHKPDSDLDIGVIIDTNPQFELSWNDADFLVALVGNVIDTFYDYYFKHALNSREQKKFNKAATNTIKKQYGKVLSDKEQNAIQFLFESSNRKELNKLIQAHLHKRTSAEQKEFFEKSVIETLRKFPDFEVLSGPLMDFFPFLKKHGEELKKKSFPYTLNQFHKQQLLQWLVEYYHTVFLDQNGASQVLKRYAKINNMAVDTLSAEQQHDCFLKSLTNNAQLSLLLNEFIEHLASQIGYKSGKIISESINILKQHFREKEITFEEKLEKRVLSELRINFNSRTVGMIESFSDSLARQQEAEIEYPLHLKTRQIKAYLSKKFPSAKINFSINILRRQRAGQHSSFLVSPQGSKAYAFMQNDFLLNPAAMICGITPMPFDLPKYFKVLSTIGVFPEKKWTLKQNLAAEYKINDQADLNGTYVFQKKMLVRKKIYVFEEETESFVLGKLPNWGEIKIPREMYLEHAIPIFLRESQKINEGKLPEALLNCWWLEMIICIDSEDVLPTSISRLLWNPDGRNFLRGKRSGQLINAILKMEKDYPALQLDPWWLKFTEMLIRFKGCEQKNQAEPDFELSTLSVTQKNIIFCFAQYMGISKIIDFENEGNSIELDEKASWRVKALVDFYNIFYSIPEERRELIHISEGQDEACSKKEKFLKQLFIESMSRVEGKLCKIGHDRALRQITNQLERLSEKKHETTEAKNFLSPLLQTVNQRVSIEDSEVRLKLKKKIPLNNVEQFQANIVYEELQKLKSVQGDIVDYFARFGLKMQHSCVRKTILNSKVKVSGDALENAVFKYYFEQNLDRKPYQLQLPFSNSLCTPRSKIKVEFNRKTGKWKFGTIISGNQEVVETETGKVIPMFEADLTEGIARFALSGSICFDGNHVPKFEKPASQVKSDVAKNSISGGELFSLAADINTFFAQFEISSREMLENIHYIRDVMMICNVNKHDTISLIVRDNFASFYVKNFQIGNIAINNIPQNLNIEGEDALAMFFMRLNSRECRLLFMRQLSALKIPLRTSNQPHLGTWVNGSNFNLPDSVKHKQNYLNGIAKKLWPKDSIGTKEQLKPTHLTHTFDQIGKAAIIF